MKALAPNTLLQNRYLIVHLIGKGGMGEVYLAVDQRLGSAVALKRTFYSDDENLGTAFEREARTLARLRHSVLPKVSDHFVENENQYLVMEHISGDDLSKRLTANGKPFPLSWVLFWADQLLDALAYLHSHEPPIIHRDIKPQNLKLTDDNNIILLDFGLSKNTGAQTNITSGSNPSHSVVGYTPHYAPMEQIRGTGTNPRSDIYSLSATLYQLLSDAVPPDALTRADTILNGTPDPIRPISEQNTEVTKAVSDVILKGMSISQDQRFASAREMQKALRDAYAQMQSATTAQTVAFNTQGEQLDGQPSRQQNIEQPAPSVSVNNEPPLQSGIETQVMPFDLMPDAPTEAEDSLPSKAQQEPDFSATIPYHLEPKDFSSDQSDVKTEFYTGGFPTDAKVEPEEKVDTAEDFAPEVTEPLIYDTRVNEEKMVEEAPLIDAVPIIVEENDEAETFIPQAETYPQDNNVQANAFAPSEIPSQPQVQPAPPKKKSTGKTLAIVGGLAALFLLILGGAGIAGFYYYNNSRGTVVTDPTPSPEATVAATPSPEPTLAADTNVNANQDVANTDTNTETNTQTNNQPEVTENPNRTPQQQVTPVKPTPRQTQVTTTTTPNRTPVKQITPRPTPKRDDRTIIDQ